MHQSGLKDIILGDDDFPSLTETNDVVGDEDVDSSDAVVVGTVDGDEDAAVDEGDSLTVVRESVVQSLDSREASRSLISYNRQFHSKNPVEGDVHDESRDQWMH